jgi:hypothetical protein
MEQIKFNTTKEIYKIIKIDFNYPDILYFLSKRSVSGSTVTFKDVMILKRIIRTEIKYKFNEYNIETT